MLLWKLGDLCKRDEHILATIDAWDNGKPFDVVLGEDVAETVSVFRYYAGWADKIYGQTIDVGNAKLAYTKHEPLGEIGEQAERRIDLLMLYRRMRPGHSLEFPNHGSYRILPRDCVRD